MMDYWSNEIFCFEKRDNGLFAELYIGEINDNFQNSLIKNKY